jgi:Ankyrin repeats (3 copies)/BTB/POZ domain
VVLLLENKADPTSLDNEQKSPLHYAIAHGHAKVVSRLLEHGADINTAAKDGTTPLHLAASKGSIPLLCLLIEKGARLDARDLRGNTALAAVPLADRAAHEVPALPRKLASDIKSLLNIANGKTQGYSDYEEEGNERVFSDVTFVVDGQQVHAHRNIVALRCPRLGKLFKHASPRDRVELRDVAFTTFQALLEWIYSEDVASLRVADPEVPFILSLLMAADRYRYFYFYFYFFYYFYLFFYYLFFIYFFVIFIFI